MRPSRDIKIRDYDASNKAVPDVLAELLRYGGFVMVSPSTPTTDGLPQTDAEDQSAGRPVNRGPEAAVSGGRAASTLWTSASNNAIGSAPRPRLQ